MPWFVSAEYTEVHDNVRRPLSIAGAQEHVRGVRRTYPDLHLTVEQQIALTVEQQIAEGE